MKDLVKECWLDGQVRQEKWTHEKFKFEAEMAKWEVERQMQEYREIREFELANLPLVVGLELWKRPTKIPQTRRGKIRRTGQSHNLYSIRKLALTNASATFALCVRNPCPLLWEGDDGYAGSWMRSSLYQWPKPVDIARLTKAPPCQSYPVGRGLTPSDQQFPLTGTRMQANMYIQKV